MCPSVLALAMVKIVKTAARERSQQTVRKRPAGFVVQQEPAPKRPAADVQRQPPSAANASEAQSQEGGVPDWYEEEDAEAQIQVYLVTASKLVEEVAAVQDASEQTPLPLRDPSTISKLEFRRALQDSISNPIYKHVRGGRPPTRTMELDVYVGVKEGSLGDQHHHAAVKLYRTKHRFLPFKLAMRWRHGIATHWSTSHTQLWSAIRYVHCTTPHKPIVDRRPEVWTRDGRQLNLHEESQEPFQAGAWNQKRQNRMSEPYAEKPKKDTFTKLDFSALVLQHRLLTPNSVLEYMQEKGSKAMQLWIHCRQRKLKEFIQDALEMEGAKQAAALEKETEWAFIERLSRGTCSCGADGCVWWSLATDFFKNNKEIDRQRLAASLRKVICMGPCKEARVPTIVGKPNCAKSTVLDPCRKVFGKDGVLGKPKLGAANGALGKLAKGSIRFIYFDDYRPVDYAAFPKDNPTIPVTDFLALFCGQPFNIQVSQSFNDGHPSGEYHKGAAMTAKEEGLWDPCGNVSREEIRHMQARVEIFRATHVVGETSDDFHVSPACAESWCRWLVVDSIAYAARHPPRSLPSGEPRRAKPLPALVSAEQMANIMKKREEALKRKAAKQRQEGPVYDDEDPFGYGGSFDE